MDAAGKWIQGKHPDTVTGVNAAIIKSINQLSNPNVHPVKQAAQAVGRFTSYAETQSAKGLRWVAVEGTKRFGLEKTSNFLKSAFDGQLGEVSLQATASIKSPLFIQSVRDLQLDFVGRTSSNAAVFDMVKRVKSHTQQQRQLLREHIPGEFHAMYGPDVTHQDHEAMTDVLARTDLASLVRDENFGVDKALSLIGDAAALDAEIKTIEKDLLAQDKDLGQYYINRTKALALYMTQGKVHNNQPRNAFNIVEFHGENLATKPSWVPSVDQIDGLASLYALQAANVEAKKRVAAVVKKYPNAVRSQMEYLEFLNLEEANTSTNRMKGYVPLSASTGAALIAAPLANKDKLLGMGYELVQNIPHTTHALFYTPVSTQAPFTQGLIQTIRVTDGGVDLYTGQRTGIASGLVLTYEQAKARSAKHGNTLLDAEAALSKDNLMPMYNRYGDVIGYEVPLTPDLIEKAGADKNLPRLMGEWRGRQVEAAYAEISNQELLDTLDKTYKEFTDKDGFININDPKALAKNFGQREAQRLMSPQFKEMVGRKPVWVRRDMVKEVLGYRNLSAVQIWEHNNPVSKATASVLDTMFGFAGRNAYADVLKAERAWQETVAFTKDAIVVKSVFVPAVNMVSNIVQLAMNGINPLAIAAAVPNKVREAEHYLKLRAQKVTLEIARESATSQEEKAKKQRQLDAVQAQMHKLSIWPLIEAGEFTSLSDGMYKPEHIKEVGTGLGDALKKRIDALPKGVSTAVKWAYLSHDTKAYQLLQKATQYGDFVAKAVLYDHLIKQGKSQEEALGKVSEEFINYEIAPGAGRGYIESIGMMWFGNYFMRATKIGLRLMRDNPLAMLMMGTGITVPFLGHIGTPLTDNIFGKAERGVIGFSIGPGMVASDMAIPALPLFRVISILGG